MKKNVQRKCLRGRLLVGKEAQEETITTDVEEKHSRCGNVYVEVMLENDTPEAECS